MSIEQTAKDWAPAFAALFSALSAGAAWRSVFLSNRAQARDLEARRAWIVARDMAIEQRGAPARSVLTFRLTNVGQRAAFAAGGHIFILDTYLRLAPREIAPFSISNELAPASDVLV